MIEITMPQAGQSMEEGTIVQWRKAPGERVNKGDILLEIETDKATIEVEASDSGTLEQILVPAGTTVAVLTPIARLRGDDEAPAAETAAPSAPVARKTGAREKNGAPRKTAPVAAGAVKPILMPKAGVSVEEATLVKWRVAPGATITKGDIIFEVETDKSVVEVEATEDGRLARIVVAEGQLVPVLQPVAYLAESDADADAFIAAHGGEVKAEAPASMPTSAPAPRTPAPTPSVAAAPVASSTPASVVATTPALLLAGDRVKASPAARRAALAAGIDLNKLGAGSGPGGRILSTDVAKAPASAATSAKAVAAAASLPQPTAMTTGPLGEPVRTKMTPMRKAIARNLLASKQNIPHWYIQRIIDADPLMAFYRAEKAKAPCSVNDVLALACSRVVMEFPAFRSQAVAADEVVEFPSANIGVAVGLEAGLVVPVILGADRLTLAQIGAESKRLAEAARGGKIEGMGKGVFTISNLGMFGVDQFTAIINPPEAAILAVSAIREDVIVKNGMMRPGRTMSLTLSADHRLIDGVLAAKFMARLKEVLEAPEVLK